MTNWRRWLIGLAPLFLIALFGFRHFAPARAQANGGGQYPGSLLAGLTWRNVGPLRGGRSYAVAGNARQPDTFYFGSAGGGVWKTIDAGRTWQPISDAGIPIGSIGAIAVAPSNPNIVYVGTGEPDIRSQHSYGIGMFKSTDAGKTWTAIGLTDSSQIGRIIVDPANSNRVYVAALGNPYESSPTRGVYRSLDGGATWKQILRNADRPSDVGAVDLAMDMKNPQVVYASMWSTRRPPWSVYAPANLPGGGLYKTTDGGDHWTKLGGGFPNDNTVGKIGIAIAPSNPNMLWASVDDLGVASPTRGPEAAPAADTAPTGGGIYRSDDAGAHWRMVNNESRLWGRGWYFEQLAVDPVNPDKAYVINTATFVTNDGGKHFTPLKGSPGGDDYHQLWINPSDGNRMVLSSDQGTVVSVDDGRTWSSWYNQSTAQIYHLAADNRYPYWLYGPQQDSGAASAAVAATRENVITFRDWLPICAGGESNSVVPDPKNPAILYSQQSSCNQFGGGGRAGGGGRGRGGAAADTTDPTRKTWTAPTVLSPVDNAIYTSSQFVFRSRDGAHSFEKVSPDLTRLNPPIPANLDPLTAKDMDEAMTGLGANHDESRYGVVYAISPSPLDAHAVWVGTDDGYIQVTHDDGQNWENVTPQAMTPWSKVSQIEASHFDANTVYASVDRHRLGDQRAYIYRTNDGGKSWQMIANGIPDGAFVNSIKEDPVQKGLLYAATELRMYVSFDDGGHWQALQNNMPVTSVRDVIVHDGDLDIATFGRGFWVLDNMAPLRQIAQQGSQIAASSAYLFKPADSVAGAGGGGGGGTPIPRDETQLENPPSGVVVYYWLQNNATTPLKLELVSSTGTVTSCSASDAPVIEPDPETANVETKWEQPPAPPSAAAGMHRFALGAAGGRGGFGGGGRRGAAAPVRDACSPPETGEVQAAPPAGRGRGGRGAGRGGRGGFGGPLTGDFTVRLTVNGQTYSQPVTIKAAPQVSFAGLIERGSGQ